MTPVDTAVLQVKAVSGKLAVVKPSRLKCPVQSGNEGLYNLHATMTLPLKWTSLGTVSELRAIQTIRLLSFATSSTRSMEDRGLFVMPVGVENGRTTPWFLPVV
jgi:hypothetical protein